MADLDATVSVEVLPAGDAALYHGVALLARKVLDSIYEFEEIRDSSEWIEALEADLQKLENSRSFAHYEALRYGVEPPAPGEGGADRC